MTDEPELGDLRALAHPLRLRILSLLTSSAMSAAEVARELGETQANVSYHLRRLHDAGQLHVAEEVRIRGGTARRYRYDPDSGNRLRKHDVEDDKMLAAILAQELQRRTEYRPPGAHGHITDAELWVDTETWETALELAHQLSLRLHAAARPPRTPGTTRVSTTISMFPMDTRR